MTNGVEQPATPNKAILDEVNADNTWFHAKKTAPLWAKQLEEAQTVQTLAGPTAAAAGDFLCRGAAGELWLDPDRGELAGEEAKNVGVVVNEQHTWPLQCSKRIFARFAHVVSWAGNGRLIQVHVVKCSRSREPAQRIAVAPRA